MKRMSTKPFVLSPGYIKSLLQGALNELVKQHGRGIRYREEWTYAISPTIAWPYATKIIFSGHGLFHANACYEGPYGTWQATLKNAYRRLPKNATREEIKADECSQISGMPRCDTPSDLYRESREQRRARVRELASQGLV